MRTFNNEDFAVYAPAPTAGDRPNYYNLVLTAAGRQQEIAAALAALGLPPDSTRYGYRALHQQPLFAEYTSPCPNAEALANVHIPAAGSPQPVRGDRRVDGRTHRHHRPRRNYTMTGIRHFTASAIVLDDHQRVLLVYHNKIQKWLYPGGHIDPNEDPAQAAQREVLEETGLHTQVICDPLFTHPAVTTHAPPFTIIEMDVVDSKVGPHRHIDLVYVLRAAPGELTAQLAEVGAARWVSAAELAELDTPPELPTLAAEATQWAKARSGDNRKDREA